MKDEDLFSQKEAPSNTSDQQRGGDSNLSALSPTPSISPEAPPPAHAPETQRRLPPRHYLRLLLVLLIVLVVLAGVYGVSRAVSPPSRQASSAFQQVHCPFAIGPGLVEGKNVRCGFLSVPEDRSQPRGPTIRLAVAVFKAPNPRPAPDPVLVLGGGPGEAQLVNTGPLINASNLARVTAGRDFILLDQRGEGYSQPSLSCQINETMLACHDRLVGEGINLNAFTTLENAADVHDLVRALGYKQVNLNGVSYGTRLALTVMRLYPADLRSVVLNSVIPPQVNFFTSIPQATGRAFDVLFQGCAADRSCNATYPHLQAVFYQLIAELNTTPITFQATSQTGSSVTVHFTGNNLVLWLRQSLYTTGLIPLLPGVIFQIRQHDYTQLASIYGQSIGTAPGLFYSIDCGEDMAFTTQHALATSVQGLPPQIQSALLNFGLFRYSICQFWGMKPVPAVQKEPVGSTIPTLILQGEYDPVTPPANGMLVAQTLSRSFFFLFPGVGHGVGSPNPCPGNIEHAFLDNPTVRPDASCISSMPEPLFA
jgi:pimeloyl-ACP methyl ester carboxylesterase